MCYGSVGYRLGVCGVIRLLIHAALGITPERVRYMNYLIRTDGGEA